MASVLEHPDLPKITDSYRRASPLLSWKTKKALLKKTAAFLSESAPTNATGSAISNWDRS